MSRTATYLKMLTVAVVVCVGGPALVQYVRPSDEELFKKYNPDLQRASLENRDRRAQEFEDYVSKLKEWSKSDKSIWFAMKEEEARRKETLQLQTARQKEEESSQREDMRRELQGGR